MIRSTDGKANAIMQMVQVTHRPQDGVELVFHRYDSRYFFFQVQAGGETGLELPTTHAEQTVARRLAGIKPKLLELLIVAFVSFHC
jgi:hypothetical protein